MTEQRRNEIAWFADVIDGGKRIAGKDYPKVNDELITASRCIEDAQYHVGVAVKELQTRFKEKAPTESELFEYATALSNERQK